VIPASGVCAPEAVADLLLEIAAPDSEGPMKAMCAGPITGSVGMTALCAEVQEQRDEFQPAS
jgi:hypothetical protein